MAIGPARYRDSIIEENARTVYIIIIPYLINIMHIAHGTDSMIYVVHHYLYIMCVYYIQRKPDETRTFKIDRDV